MIYMSAHKDRAKLREESNPPINFTCGKCKKVHPFVDGYDCPDDVDETVDEEEV
jgi:hypothetical protein